MDPSHGVALGGRFEWVLHPPWQQWTTITHLMKRWIMEVDVTRPSFMDSQCVPQQGSDGVKSGVASVKINLTRWVSVGIRPLASAPFRTPSNISSIPGNIRKKAE